MGSRMNKTQSPSFYTFGRVEVGNRQWRCGGRRRTQKESAQHGDQPTEPTQGKAIRTEPVIPSGPSVTIRLEGGGG